MAGIYYGKYILWLVYIMDSISYGWYILWLVYIMASIYPDSSLSNLVSMAVEDGCNDSGRLVHKSPVLVQPTQGPLSQPLKAF